ncbi:sulfate adenylyltransferase subunit 1 [Vibrio inusitatus NBRC 102082]|uniref:Sulfate adenylyltransferase subunit 1 n=1 Tax=Vibrio inusitatus NBRC 102082 TaxID=1219070 RepID=A0A4Y3I0I2_9VIBR|nr:sulfate adenylyltransferase subunit CysN [Vibrio inusitatus]GEA52372.1 sulfate adenylyltransferase subunit 1 [Vibrio inusitatus NBRC 102082]
MNTISNLLSVDVEAYLKQHENKDLLRFITCGSVDDGKSTLIGRLLYDNQMIFEDQLLAIQKDSKKYNTTDQEFDLALLVDGLQSEREQGITIDVAYRYFTTDQRKFIIADTPGHEQYTRNMATGASTSDLAIILIDARHGVQTQTRRHSFICSLLGIKHAIIAVNKMDTVDFSQQRYQSIKKEYREFAKELNFESIQFVPVSALHGDNVVFPSKNMSWYPGSTLMRLLNSAKTNKTKEEGEFRFPVQYVNRPNLDFRGFCGTVVSGEIRVGDRIQVLPSGKESKVKSIVTFDGDLTSSYAGQAVTLTLEDEVDISRGDILVRPDQQPHYSNAVSSNVVWMNEDALQLNREYLIKVGTKTVTGQVSKIEHRVDVNSMQKLEANQLNLNEIGLCHLNLNEKVVFDAYDSNRITGAFIIIDRLTNATVGAGMIEGALESKRQSGHEYSEFELELNQLVRKHFPHWDAKDLLSKG